MRSYILWLLIALIWNTAKAETPLQLMELSDRTSKVVDARSELTMTLSNADGEQRVRKLVTMTKLKPDGVNNMRVLRFLAPADIKGTVTLLIEQSGVDDDMWIYLPALKKTRRLVSDNKRDSFIGSDLTFGDLIGHKPADWTSTLLREESLDGKAVYVIESLPKDEAIKNQTSYSKRLLWIDKNNFTALKTDYWDETGQLLISTSSCKPSGNRPSIGTVRHPGLARNNASWRYFSRLSFSNRPEAMPVLSTALPKNCSMTLLNWN
jgi:outer membrane lipoprotein-sorting protein